MYVKLCSSLFSPKSFILSSLSGTDWGQEEKGTTEDEMVGWHRQVDGHEFEQLWGDGEGQGSLPSMGSQRVRLND